VLESGSRITSESSSKGRGSFVCLPLCGHTWMLRRIGLRVRHHRDGGQRRVALGTQQMNRLSSVGLIVLSLTALLVVLWGYTQRPLPDEGMGAHVFQLSVAALLPLTIAFLSTADWSQPRRTVWPLAVAAAATVV